MSKANGRQKRALEGLAAALAECFEAAVEAGEKRTRAVLNESLSAHKQTLDEALNAQNEALSAHKRTLDEALSAQNRTLNEALSAQNRTLRMIWQQCGGRPDQRLPIDE